MNNEIGRKLTSLTLMTIMLAGGMVIAAPSMMPVAHAANSTLFVSAESSQFNNTFGGAQVIEVVVSDPLIATLDEVHGSPDVQVNGQDVTMAQGNDGSWYAYIADKDFVNTADADAATGLQYGLACSGSSSNVYTATAGATFAQATDVWFSGTHTAGSGDGDTIAATTGTTCVDADGDIDIATSANIVQAAKGLNSGAATNVTIGQIGLNDTDAWPFIQTYDFNPTGSVKVEYNKAGVNEITTLTFDTPEPTITADRTNVPLKGKIFAEFGDPMLNLDPTSEDLWRFNATTGAAYYRADTTNAVPVSSLGFESNGVLKATATHTGTTMLTIQGNNDVSLSGSLIGIFETGANTAIFSTGDDADNSTIIIASTAVKGKSGVIDYNDTPISFVATDFWGDIQMDETSIGDEWNSGEEMTVTLIDEDQNKSTRGDEDLDLNDPNVTLVPSLQIGTPKMLTTSSTIDGAPGTAVTIDSFSNIARVTGTSSTSTAMSISGSSIVVDTGMTVATLRAFADASGSDFIYLNYDVRSLLSTTLTDIAIHDSTDTTSIVDAATDVLLTAKDVNQGHVRIILASAGSTITETENVRLTFTGTAAVAADDPFVVDFFSFGDKNNNAIYRMELEETGDNTSEFVGSVEYIMTNQLNKVATTYDSIVPISDEIKIIVTEDLTDEDGPRINYLDLGADGVSTQIADQQDAPSHSGVVDLDMDTYKIADTVVVTLTDMDLNVDSDLIDIFVAQTSDKVDNSTAATLHLLDITFDDIMWTDRAANGVTDTGGDTCTDDALSAAGFTLVETDTASGVFVGSFQVPSTYCNASDASVTTTGTDIEVNYNDHRDASGETIEVGDGAGIRANTGSISLDRTVYPVPWGAVADFGSDTGAATPNGKSVFPIHATGLTGNVTADAETIKNGTGDLTIHIRVNDADLDVSAIGEDKMNADRTVGSNSVGPVKITVSRGTDDLTLAYAGGSTASTTRGIVVGADASGNARTMGPITEVAGDTGIFELDFTIRYTDGPESTTCPATTSFTNLDSAGTAVGDRFKTAANADATNASGKNFCILQGDILTVEYTDAVDASGNTNTVTDSATFDLRNGVLQSDKSVYIIGSDMILTIIDPDWDLDNDGAETYDLDVVEWDSDAATATMGDQIVKGATNETSNGAFDPEPSAFRETGDSTGIFQVVVEIPASLNNDNLERGEQVKLQYTDWGPSGAAFVGQEEEDMNLTVYTSNFGATVELDQKVYTWTDKVYITIVAPDHNFDSNLVDTIGNTASDAVKLSTRAFDVDKYSLVETGTDTGIFTGEVILTGFSHDSNGDGTATGPSNTTSADSTGPTDGYLETDNDDGLTVSFEYSEDKTVVGSALIRWNVGEIQWLEASYPASGTGVVRVIDADMNLNPEAVDNFKVNVWSDSDSGGINLTVTETNESTGIFEGTVFFTVDDASSGHRLRVSEGDTVTAEYEDNTLPVPYTKSDELDVTATTLIGTVVPPLERAPAANLRTVDAFGNSLDAVSVDQQVQLTADLSNGQDNEQAFAYLVQVQDENGVTVSLAWITGSLSAGQSFSPALSWIPTEAGSFTATAFVWESVDNPTALSPSVSTTVNVR